MKRAVNFRTIVLTLLVSLFALNISAQGQGRGFQMTEEDIKERVENTAKTLKLTDEQHKKVLAVEMDFYNKMQIERQKMMSAGGPPANRTAMREKMGKMRDERNAQYEEVLTTEQYEEFIKMQEQRRSEMRQQQPSGTEGAEGAEERPARGRGQN